MRRDAVSSGRSWALAAAVLVALAAFAHVQLSTPPFAGDEPHYVVYARSLAEGWGLDLARAYEPEHVAPFYAGPLDPHARHYDGASSHLASWHGVGLPVLLAPAVGVRASAFVARLVVIATAALLAYHLTRLTTRVVACPPPVAAVVALAVLASPPLLFYSGLVFPEVPAALLLVVAIRLLVGSTMSWRRAAAASAVAGLLPWLGYRYGTLAAAVVLAVAAVRLASSGLRRGDGRQGHVVVAALAPVVAPVAVLGGGLLAFGFWLFGRWAPPADTAGNGGYFELDNLYEFGVGVLLGFPSGALALAPLLAVVPAGVAVLRRWSVVAGAAAAAVYVAYNAWFGSPGTGPPGRYLATVVPLAAIPIAALVTRGSRPVRAVCLGLAVATAVSAVTASTRVEQFASDDRSGIQPLSATARWWPYASDREFQRTSVRTSADQLLHGTGAVETVDGERLVIARPERDRPGAVAYGPYQVLASGRFVARFDLRGLDTDEASDVDLDVVENGRVVTTAGASVEPRQRALVEVGFDATGRGPIEARVHWADDAPIGVAQVDIDAVTLRPRRSSTGEWWKAVLWTLGAIASAIAAARASRPGSGTRG